MRRGVEQAAELRAAREQAEEARRRAEAAEKRLAEQAGSAGAGQDGEVARLRAEVERLRSLLADKERELHELLERLQSLELQLKVCSAERERQREELASVQKSSLPPPVGVGLKLMSHHTSKEVFVQEVVKGLSGDLSNAIQAGDVLLYVDDKSVDGKHLDEIKQWCLGPRGSPVEFVFRREQRLRRVRLRRGAFGPEHAQVDHDVDEDQQRPPPALTPPAAPGMAPAAAPQVLATRAVSPRGPGGGAGAGGGAGGSGAASYWT